MYCVIDENFNILPSSYVSIDDFEKRIEDCEKLDYIYVKIHSDRGHTSGVRYGKNKNNIVYNTIQHTCKFVSYDNHSRFTCYKYIPDERVYLDLMEHVLLYCQEKDDRTGTGVFSMFGKSLEFNLKNNILPLLTTKKTFYNGVLKELLWFLSGSTDAKELNDQGVKIWNGNGSLENLRKLGFDDRPEGELGPVYGYQWRHWGASYSPQRSNKSTGFDQIQWIVNEIKTNPHSRRLILNAWNVSDIDQMVLPPCHMMCQFYVNGDELSCNMYQRSADMFLGVPFNIASYALLTHMIAQVTGYKASRLRLNFGDCHVYSNHIKQVEEQLTRTVYNFPKIHIDTSVNNIDDFKFEHFTLNNYKCHPTIKADMAV